MNHQIAEENIAGLYKERVEIVLRFYNEVRHYICTTNINQNDVEDAVQDTFIEALTNIHKLREIESMKWWLLKIAKRQACKYMKKDKRKNDYESSFEMDDNVQMRTDILSDKDMDDLLKGIQREQLNKMISRLNEKEIKVLLLYYAYGYKQKEIARLTGESLTNVKTLAKRSRDKLREIIQKEWEIYDKKEGK